jgi:hypothetical protein
MYFMCVPAGLGWPKIIANTISRKVKTASWSQMEKMHYVLPSQALTEGA